VDPAWPPDHRRPGGLAQARRPGPGHAGPAYLQQTEHMGTSRPTVILIINYQIQRKRRTKQTTERLFREKYHMVKLSFSRSCFSFAAANINENCS
jgi:hypothetical protein